WRDFTPQSTGITWSNQAGSSCPMTTSGGLPGTGAITVNNVPAGAQVWVTVHLDYNLRGLTAPSAAFGNPPINYTPFTSTAKITNTGISTSSGSLLGRGKKVTVIYGRATDSSGNPLQNVWVRVTQGTNQAYAQTDAGGNYVFYDGESCSIGSLQFCSGTLTTWAFPKGNSSVTLDVLGDNLTTPTAGASYPTARTTASIVSGTQTFAKFTATPPGYTFTVANGSAYNRDFKFGP